jgi:hypothetical protein
MPVITTPISPLEAGGEMFFREKTQSIFIARASTARPLSQATDMFDTEFEDDSDLEDGSAPKRSFESVSDVCSCVTLCM